MDTEEELGHGRGSQDPSRRQQQQQQQQEQRLGLTPQLTSWGAGCTLEGAGMAQGWRRRGRTNLRRQHHKTGQPPKSMTEGHLAGICCLSVAPDARCFCSRLCRPTVNAWPLKRRMNKRLQQQLLPVHGAFCSCSSSFPLALAGVCPRHSVADAAAAAAYWLAGLLVWMDGELSPGLKLNSKQAGHGLPLASVWPCQGQGREGGSCACARGSPAPRWTSSAGRQPAKFKHINKRRKRNQPGFPE